MNPNSDKKRTVAAYLAYRLRENEYEFFLQKRDSNARASAGKFGLFGGGVEADESVEECLYREVREEMNHTPISPTYFSRYEHAIVVFHLFIEKVSSDFESLVMVEEGEYGKFFTSAEAEVEPKATDMVRLMTRQVSEHLARHRE